MIDILGALVVGGIAGAIAKDKLVGNPKLESKVREIEGIYKENDSLREDKKKLSRQVEDLLSELKKLFDLDAEKVGYFENYIERTTAGCKLYFTDSSAVKT